MPLLLAESFQLETFSLAQNNNQNLTEMGRGMHVRLN
jgi:hypothetical protein